MLVYPRDVSALTSLRAGKETVVADRFFNLTHSILTPGQPVQRWPYNARRLVGLPLACQFLSHWYDSIRKYPHVQKNRDRKRDEPNVMSMENDWWTCSPPPPPPSHPKKKRNSRERFWCARHELRRHCLCMGICLLVYFVWDLQAHRRLFFLMPATVLNRKQKSRMSFITASINSYTNYIIKVIGNN